MSYFNEIYGDPELSSKAKMVLLYLHDRANQKGEIWYAIGALAKDLSLSRSTIKRAIAELILQGKVEKHGGTGRIGSVGPIATGCSRYTLPTKLLNGFQIKRINLFLIASTKQCILFALI